MRELLIKLAANKVQLSVEGDNLSILLDEDNDSLSDELLSEIKRNKSGLIEYLSTYGSQNQYAPIVPVAPANGYAVSDNQKRLWLLCQREETCRAFNLPNHIELSGHYVHADLQEAFSRVIGRHEILRTVFGRDEAGELKQFILSPEHSTFRLKWVDLRNAGAAAIDQYMRHESAQLFDLEKGPLLSASLIQIDGGGSVDRDRSIDGGGSLNMDRYINEGRYILYYNIHHLITDGWSIGLLAREVMEQYHAIRDGVTLDLAPLRIQYKDYANWQQTQLLSDEFRSHRDYWLKQLAGEIEVLALPAEHSRPPVLTFNGQTLSVLIEKDLTDALTNLCRRWNGTLFMGLLSVCKALFYRYTAHEDIIIGTPVAGRVHAELENQMGVFYNMLPLRTKFRGKESYEALFKQVRAVTLQAYEHQVYSFDRIVQDLGLKRDMSHSVLFDVMLALQNQAERPYADAAQGDRIVEKGYAAAHFDISLDFLETQNGLNLDLTYNTDIYDKEGMIRLIRHFTNFLASVVANPALPIDRVNYLTKEEQDQLLHDFAGTPAGRPVNTNVVKMFMDQVHNDPAQIAIVYGKQQMTYGELDLKSNQLSQYLHGLGVRKGSVIPICLNRSVDLLVVIWGILKAGAAYVPIDTSYPKERIKKMLDDSQASWIITESNCSNLVSDDPSVKLILIDADRPEIEQALTDRLPVVIGSEDLAYIIYTSGSTGNPKGVMIMHGGLANLMHEMTGLLDVTAQSGILAITTYSFDMCKLELYLVTVNGGKMILLDRECPADGYLLAEAIRTYRPSFIQATPSTWQMLLDCKLKSVYGAQILTGGEALNERLKEQLLRMDATRVWNLYGPTEATVWATAKQLHAGERISIGKPIGNVSVYILDPSQQLLPLHVPGEIYIGGIQLASGYRNQEGLTREKFIDSPFVKGERLYRTGDRAKWRADGNIEYLERIDQQIKLYGHRIEPGEIEYALTGMEGVESAVVVAGQNEDGSKYLAAYLISREELGIAAIREWLRARVPEYMVPNFFIRLPQFPMNANGKIDRKALPKPDVAGLESGAVYVAPRNHTESLLTSLFGQLFNKPAVGIKESFFEMGGDSIRAVTLTVLLKENGYDLSIGNILHYPVLEDLALFLDERAGSSIREAQADERITGSAEAKSMAPLTILEADHFDLTYNQQLYYQDGEFKHATGAVGFYLENFEMAAFLRAYNQLLSDLEVLRVRFLKQGDKAYQQVLPVNMNGNTLHFSKVAQLDSESVSAVKIRQDMLERPFDLLNGEVMRWGVQHTDRDALVLMVVHHLVTDYTSNVLLKDVFIDYYRQKASARQLPSYLDFVGAQKNYLLSAEADRPLRFWRDRLDPCLIGNESLDRPVKPSVQDTSVVLNHIVISGGSFKKVRDYCKTDRLFTSSFILGICSQFYFELYPDRERVLALYVTGGRDMNIPGFPVIDMIGQFTNYLPLRLDHAMHENITVVCNYVQRMYHEAKLYQEIPYEFIRDDFQRRKGVDLAQLPGLILNYIELPDEELSSDQPSWCEKSVPGNGKADNGFGAMFIKCHKYTNAIVMEWGVRCPEGASDAAVSEGYFVRRIHDLIDRVCSSGHPIG